MSEEPKKRGRNGTEVNRRARMVYLWEESELISAEMAKLGAVIGAHRMIDGLAYEPERC